MSVVEHPPRAAPASGAAFAYHRTGRLAAWLGGGRGVRLASSLAAGFLGELLTGWSGGLLFPLTPAVSLTAGLVFGGWGLAGAAAGQLAAVYLLSRDFFGSLIFALAFSLTGLAGWAVFRWVPTLGRGLPNLRSFLAILAAASMGGAAGALLTLASGLLPTGETAWTWIWTWVTGELVSAALLAPPILLAFHRWGRRWMVEAARGAAGGGPGAGRYDPRGCLERRGDGRSAEAGACRHREP